MPRWGYERPNKRREDGRANGRMRRRTPGRSYALSIIQSRGIFLNLPKTPLTPSYYVISPKSQIPDVEMVPYSRICAIRRTGDPFLTAWGCASIFARLSHDAAPLGPHPTIYAKYRFAHQEEDCRKIRRPHRRKNVSSNSEIQIRSRRD